MNKKNIILIIILTAVAAGYVYLNNNNFGRKYRIAPGINVTAPLAGHRNNPLVDQMVREIDDSLPVIKQMMSTGDEMMGCSLINLNRGKAIGLGLTTHPVVTLANETKCQGIL